MKSLDKIAKELNALAGIDIFKNTRRREYIEARSLFCLIAYKYYKLTYAQIASYLRKAGKTSDHSTILHAHKSFDMYQRYAPHLIEWLDILIGSEDTFDRDRIVRLMSHKINLITSSENLIEIKQLIDHKFVEEVDNMDIENKAIAGVDFAENLDQLEKL